MGAARRCLRLQSIRGGLARTGSSPSVSILGTEVALGSRTIPEFRFLQQMQQIGAICEQSGVSVSCKSIRLIAFWSHSLSRNMSAVPGYQSEDAGSALAGVGVFMQQDMNDSRYFRDLSTCIRLRF